MAGRRDTERNRLAARAVVLAGVLIMVVAGWQAMAYSTFLDPDDVCTVHHLCDEAANAAALHTLSWWTVGGVCGGLPGTGLDRGGCDTGQRATQVLLRCREGCPRRHTAPVLH